MPCIWGWAKVGVQLWVHKTEFTLVLLLITYCIMYLYDNCKPTCAHCCIQKHFSFPLMVTLELGLDGRERVSRSWCADMGSKRAKAWNGKHVQTQAPEPRCGITAGDKEELSRDFKSIRRNKSFVALLVWPSG